MGIQKEVWATDIAQNLYPNNTFLVQSRNDNAFVEGKKVYLPQSGSAPGVVVNRTTLPATGSQRTDTTTDYDLDSFTTDPTTIRNIEEIEVSYDKRMSVLEDHIGALNTQIAYRTATLWAPVTASRIVRTTGANRVAMAPGATGNRKKITLADILSVKRILDADDVPSEDRFMLIPAEMYNDLLEISDVLTSDKMGTANLPSGAVGRIYGFSIYMRSTALIFTNAATPAVRPLGYTPAITDNAAALFWHKNYVRRALGDVTIFSNENDATYYGSVFSAEVRAGGRRARADEKGVVVLVEAAGV